MALFPIKKGTIIFVPGIMIPSQFISWNWLIKAWFWGKGWDFQCINMPLGDSILERAEVVRTWMAANIGPTTPYHLVGHSMGGLDCRQLLNVNYNWARPQSFTTISTPHLGSYVADALMAQTLGPNGTPELNAFQRAGRDLTTAACLEFNKNVPEPTDFPCYSIGFKIPEPILLNAGSVANMYTWQVMANGGDRDNDGMVSVRSANGWGIPMPSMLGPHINQVNPFNWHGKYIWMDTFNAVLTNLD